MSPNILDISEFKKRFDPLLTHELDRHIARASSFTNDQDCRALLSHIKELALAGGKRIRPYISYLLYTSAGGDTEDILEALVAFEIFHTFALIHDDIIDHGSIRHNRPSMHEFARSLGSDSTEKGIHLAEGLAMLAGDLTFSWSRETFSRSAPSAQAQSLFDDMVYAVVLGQILDVKIMSQQNPTEEVIMEKTFLKTAEYTFTYPMLIGASLAGKYDEYAAWCRDIGASLGIAFQVQDDLLDIIGDEDATGKKTLKDIAEGQHTVFTAYIRSHGSEKDKSELAGIFGHVHDIVSPVQVKDLFERSGAVAYGKELIASKITHAKAMLDKLEVAPYARAAWEEFIDRIERRTS